MATWPGTCLQRRLWRLLRCRLLPSAPTSWPSGCWLEAEALLLAEEQAEAQVQGQEQMQKQAKEEAQAVTEKEEAAQALAQQEEEEEEEAAGCCQEAPPPPPSSCEAAGSCGCRGWRWHAVTCLTWLLTCCRLWRMGRCCWLWQRLAAARAALCCAGGERAAGLQGLEGTG